MKHIVDLKHQLESYDSLEALPDEFLLEVKQAGFSDFQIARFVLKPTSGNFETENLDSVLYGTKVFELSRAEVKELMRENGFSELEEEDEDGEHRISFGDAIIDFFFDGDVMKAVNWSVLVDDQGNII